MEHIKTPAIIPSTNLSRKQFEAWIVEKNVQEITTLCVMNNCTPEDIPDIYGNILQDTAGKFYQILEYNTENIPPKTISHLKKIGATVRSIMLLVADSSENPYDGKYPEFPFTQS